VTSQTLEGLTGPHIIFQGVNVHVRSAETWDSNTGLGNLIVGWDQAATSPASVRTGANNLVVGDAHSFTDNGGLLAGYRNSVSAFAGCAVGGIDNKVSGAYCTALGGESNTATYAGGSAGYTTVVGVDGHERVLQHRRFVRLRDLRGVSPHRER
jgi:hypothetical protein